MNDRTKKLLIAVAVVAAAYLAYRWYENRQTGPSGLGTNLNSLPSALVGGSTGPMSGLQYYAGATNVYVTEQVTQAATSSGNKVGTAHGKSMPMLKNGML